MITTSSKCPDLWTKHMPYIWLRTTLTVHPHVIRQTFLGLWYYDRTSQLPIRHYGTAWLIFPMQFYSTKILSSILPFRQMLCHIVQRILFDDSSLTGAWLDEWTVWCLQGYLFAIMPPIVVHWKSMASLNIFLHDHLFAFVTCQWSLQVQGEL